MKRKQKFSGPLLMTALIFFCDDTLGVSDPPSSPSPSYFPSTPRELSLLNAEVRTTQQLRERVSSLSSEVSRLQSENEDLKAKIYRLNAWRWGGAVVAAVIVVNVLLRIAVGGRKPHVAHQTVVMTKCPHCRGHLDDGATRCAECGCVI